MCVCVLGIRASCAKAGEPIEMLFEVLTLVCPRNHVGLLDGVQIARGDRTAMRHFANLLWTLVIVNIIIIIKDVERVRRCPL